MKQHAFSFPNTALLTRENYVVSTCNAEAHQWLEMWPKWPLGAVGALILGEPHSGKTHLCQAFIEKHSHARFLNGQVCAANHPFEFKESLFVLDDADYAPEPWLFHFFNHAKENGAQFVMTMSKHHQDWCALPDLSSRLRTLSLFQLNLPDDAMVHALLKKNLADHGVFVDDQVLIYLGKYIDRSYAVIDQWVQLLDRLSAEQKRNITIAFVREILNKPCQH